MKLRRRWHRESLVEQFPYSGIAATGADEREQAQRLPIDGGDVLRCAEHVRGVLGRVCEPTAVERGTRAVPQQVQPKRVEAVLDAMAETGFEVAIAAGVVARERGAERKVVVRPPDVKVQTVREGELEAPLELLPAVRPRRARRCADAVQSVDDNLRLTDRLGELDRARSPGAGTVGVRVVHPQIRLRGVRPRELPAGRNLLEQRYRFLPGSLRLRPTPSSRRPPVRGLADHLRGRGQLRRRLPVGPYRLDRRSLPHADRLVHVVDLKAFVRAPLEQLRPGLRRQRVRVSKSPRVLRRRLAMRAHCRGPLGRCRSETENGVGVARGVRMVRESCRIGRACGRLD